MKYTSAEVKSGLLIVVSLLLLLGWTVWVGRYMGGEKQAWEIRFGYVNGLEMNAPVYFAGREVGKVSDIKILPGKERPIVLTVEVNTEVKLRKNSQAFVDTLGLMGEKFIELTPGSESEGFLEGGAIIEGEDPIPTHVLVRKMNLLADRMDEMTRELNPLMQSLNGLVGGQSDEISKIIVNLHETSVNVRDMTNDLKYRPWRLLRKD